MRRLYPAVEDDRVMLRARILSPIDSGPRSHWLDAKLDTGSRETCIPIGIVRYFSSRGHSLKPLPPVQRKLGDGATRSTFDRVLARIEVQDSRKNVWVTDLNLGQCLDGFLVRNHDRILIGMDVLRHWRMTLDGPGQYAIVEIP